MREIKGLNKNWEFTRELFPEFVRGGSSKNVELVYLPHNTGELSYNYFDDSVYQGLWGYRKTFTAPRAWADKTVRAIFEGAAHHATVYLNGVRLAEHHGGYTAFTVDLSSELRPGSENLLAVELDSRENLNQPPFGGVIDYMTFGGLYREVRLEVSSREFIENIFVQTPAGDVPQILIQSHLHLAAGKNLLSSAVYDNSNRTVNKSSEPPEDMDEAEGTKANNSNDTKSVDSTGEVLEKAADKNFDEEKINDKIKENNIQSTNSIDEYSLVHRVLDQGRELAGGSLPASETLLQFAVPGAQLWDTENPKLYTLESSLYWGNIKLDTVETVFGFRQAVFKKDGFYLNGKRMKLRGLNRHQSYPFSGYAMPQRAQQLDADICKYELGLNAVRTSHYPQSQHFIRRCDELGLLVFTEIPGWQHIGDEEWKSRACANVSEMVIQYRNHPSIVIWGVRINESQDDDEFYTETNAIAHGLDPSRQTGGVRFLQKSSLLEDVYTFNDFSHVGSNRGVLDKSKVTSDMSKPYLITEYNGHMFPTKPYDWEGRRLEHALRHARVVDGYYGKNNICGGFGWCMFDYNTHMDFGSGDRICYHGVMDMYRNPKMAASVYSSQQENIPVLEISSSMDIGDHPGGNTGDIYAFTNADSVKLYKNDELIKEFFPDRAGFPSMPHPPVKIDDLVGGQLEEKEGMDTKTSDSVKKLMKSVATVGLAGINPLQKTELLYLMKSKNLSLEECTRIFNTYMSNWGSTATSYKFEAIKNGEVIKTVIREPIKSTALEVRADTDSLNLSGGYDLATVRIRAVDQNGNTLPYCMEPVNILIDGPGILIGPATAVLRGGMSGCYIKSTGISGTIKLTLDAGSIGSQTMEFIVQ